MSEVIVLENVSKIYGKNNPVVALDNVSLTVDEGDYISIQGPSGSGKSTLLNVVGCLDRPSKGKLTVEGTEISTLSENQLALVRRERIGFIFQTFNLIPVLSAVENVELPMEDTGLSKKQMREKAEKLLRIVGLKERFTHRPQQLSGGERQRVAIARALANDPKIILADEPTGNLDSKTGKSIMKLLRELNRNIGTTVLVVTHDNAIAKKADRRLHVMDGRIKKDTRTQGITHEIAIALDISQKVAEALVKARYRKLSSVLELDHDKLKRVKGIKSKKIPGILKKIRAYEKSRSRA